MRFHNSTVNHQRGFVTSMLVAAIGLIIASLSAALLLSVTKYQFDTKETRYFKEVQKQVATCVNDVLPAQAWFYDATKLGVNYDATIVSLCGLPNDKGIKYQITDLLLANNIAFRRVAYWIGSYGSVDVTTLNRATGVLSLAADAVNGATESSYERDKGFLVQLNNQLRELVYLNTKRFAAMYNTSADAGFNFYRAAVCASPTPGEIPCSDSAVGGVLGWKDVNVINNAGLFADQPPTNNPWGLPVYYCNAAECGAYIVPPFSLIFSSKTPWGTEVSLTAMQAI